MVKVKVCGLSRIEDIDYCNELKPDYIGFILDFPKSKRNISFEQASLLKSHLDGNIKAVGVFVNSPVDTIVNLCRSNTIDIVQLHGNEDANYILELKSKVSNPIVKAVRVQSAEEILQADTLPCDYLLLDTYVSNMVGGSGLTFDWSIIPQTTKPYFLAGGLNAQNVCEAINTCNPYAVDVSSSMEVNGYKSYDKIREYISKVRGMLI
jgi:phosphoribosylanthranilate isomerase